MANSLCLVPLNSLTSPTKPGVLIGGAPKLLRITHNTGGTCFGTHHSSSSVMVKAAVSDNNTNPGAKTNSLVCANCDGNGALACSQCDGAGVNSVDRFDGRFKAGSLCWLCRGKKEMLCGNCNGAGFMGGFMSTFDE